MKFFSCFRSKKNCSEDCGYSYLHMIESQTSSRAGTPESEFVYLSDKQQFVPFIHTIKEFKDRKNPTDKEVIESLKRQLQTEREYYLEQQLTFEWKLKKEQEKKFMVREEYDNLKSLTYDHINYGNYLKERNLRLESEIEFYRNNRRTTGETERPPKFYRRFADAYKKLHKYKQ